jgi:GAF domain-containing protein
MAALLEESARQRILDTYRIVDSLPEEAYQDIVRLASILCDTPMALVTLLDRDRQWFKASHGLEGTGTPRDEAFCNHAIETPTQLMEVPDARTDRRFTAHPLVTGDFSLRFYAGMPLVTEGGAAVGTVCVLDKKPRELDHEQRAGLQALARLTMTLLDARLHQQELERAVLLAEATQAEAASAPAAAQAVAYTVAILQVQDLAGHALRIGERSLERLLQELDAQLHAVLAPTSGDCINRTSHSADFIAVLHGLAAAATQQALCDTAAAFATRHGLQILCGSASAGSGAERIERVYMRADEALTQAKDAALS